MTPQGRLALERVEAYYLEPPPEDKLDYDDWWYSLEDDGHEYLMEGLTCR